MQSQLLDELNDSQRAAVTYCDGASLVIAGAGSGKTRVLTYKIAYLLEQGLKPWNILALTFTNKAAREMKQRIARQVGEETASHLWMGTFHSIFSRILRTEAQTLGYTSNFTIYDQNDSRSLVKSIVKEMGLDEKVYKPAVVENRISMAKNRLISPSAYARNSQLYQIDMSANMPAVRDIYEVYWNRCHKSNAMDFDDLLVNTYILFKQFPDICKKYVERFLYVLVDEYQDTNFAQHQIVMQLTLDRQRVCVVGDDAQSIYGFRGADIDNILNFTKSYKQAKLFKLERNYRSTKFIVQAANSLIKHNVDQIQKDVYSRNDSGEPIRLHCAYSDTEEAVIVCNEIERMRRREQLSYSDFAILYRTNSQSRSFEEAMRKRNIPYRIYGGLSFYQRKEVKDVIAYFRIVVNPDDEEALKRIINYPARGIGNTTIAKIAQNANTNGVSLWHIVTHPEVLDANAGTRAKLSSFGNLISSFVERFATEDAYELGMEILKESGVIADIMSGREPEDLSRQENLEELMAGLQDFVESRREEGNGDQTSLSDYLQEVSLLTDLDSDKDADVAKVTLMTIHSAKGLEFPTVFVVGMEENIFPSPMAMEKPRQLEEERRLFYVAITRAERHCMLTCAQNRYRYGRMEFDTPSRFLRDIDPQYMVLVNGDDSQKSEPHYRPAPRTHFEVPKSRNSEPSKFKPVTTSRVLISQSSSANPVSGSSSRPNASIVEGNIIEHERFGIGTVIRVEGTGENLKATVQFKNNGTKQLLLKFARFTIIG